MRHSWLDPFLYQYPFETTILKGFWYGDLVRSAGGKQFVVVRWFFERRWFAERRRWFAKVDILLLVVVVVMVVVVVVMVITPNLLDQSQILMGLNSQSFQPV